MTGQASGGNAAPSQTVAIGTDHAGFPLKAPIVRLLESRGLSVLDFGCHSEESCDYPDFIRPAAKAVADGRAAGGIVLGGSGNGEAIAANKVRGIRCGVCWNEWSARLTKEHNDANMIAIGARVVAEELALAIVQTWLDAEFEGGRHQRRVDKLEAAAPAGGKEKRELA
jgi:ribose 5-phosphate isomerase B